jgi:hypothetical protein
MLLITQPRVGTAHNEIIALQAAAHGDGWEVYSAPMGWRLPEHLTTSGVKGVPYGSQIFCEVIAQQMNWVLKQNSFDWLAKIPRAFTKRQVDFMTLDEARKITERKFIKPADDKCFDAKIYEPREFQPHESIPKEYPVLVSDIVKWNMEYRTFVGKGKSHHFPFAWSNYMFHGQVNEPKLHRMIPGDEMHIDFFMRDLLWACFKNDLIGPCVIDVGIIPGKGWAVIETNPAWASGLYGCDALGALQVMEQACGIVS